MTAPEMVARTLSGWRTEDGRNFTDELEAWDHEIALARKQVLATCKDHVQAGSADALSVATALLEAPGVFAAVLERVHTAENTRKARRHLPAYRPRGAAPLHVKPSR